MKKKKLFTLLAAVIFVLFAAALSFGCSSDGEGNKEKGGSVKGSDGLLYTLFEDGSYYICTGYYGTSTETDITIASIYNGLPVKEIGSLAFAKDSHAWETIPITSVTIPNSVTTIGELAFYGCSELMSISIPDSVIEIDSGAFDDTAYYNDENNWKNDALYIGKHLIGVKSSVSGEYSIKAGTKTIAGGAFYDCTGLTSITIPNSVTSIGYSAFEGCTGLTSITIPNSVTSIGYSAFEDCTGLTSITIPNSVTSIGWGAFEGCTGLTSVTIPDSVTDIGCDVFDYTAYYKDENNWENDVLYIGKHLIEAKSSKTGEYTIKQETKTIANYAFSGCTGLTSITIPDSVTSIGGNAFYGCTGLTSVTIPNSVTGIGWGAFEGCTKLTSVTIPNSVTSIGGYAFCECTGLTSITIPNSVTSIGNRAFGYCTGLTSITIPDSVTSISDAFRGCTGLTSITIPNRITYIWNHAFSGCTGLTSITIPNSVTNIGGWAFDDTAYYNDESNWENNALYIGSHLISVKTSISGEYTIKAGTKTIASAAFRNCTDLTGVTIPNSVTSIGGGAFQGCTALTSIAIPNGVTSIDEWSFYGCAGLSSIVIPNSVTNIGIGVVDDCGELSSVYFLGTEAEWRSINIDPLNSSFASATCYYYKKTRPTDEGNYWHYDADGVTPVVW